MNTGLAVGVDVGGTKIAAGLIAGDGTLIARARRDTPAGDRDAIVATVAELAVDLCADQGLGQLALGVGVAGLVDEEGAIVYAPNLDLTGCAVRRLLQERLDVPVVVANDGLVAAWGEFRFGAASAVDGSVVMLTLGTGVGGGLIVNDDLALGSHGLAGEFGHIIVEEGGAQCPCGNRGCLEAYASGTAIGKLAARRLEAGEVPRDSALHGLAEITGKSVTVNAHAGDAAAVDVLATCGFWLGVGITSLVNALDPAVIVVGGGAMQAGELLLDPARCAYRERVLGRRHRQVAPVIRAVLGDDAGVIGAAMLALDA